MSCRRVKESEIDFDSHMSGFVYKVRVHNQILIKKEIPGPDTVEEFLYEINALNRLRSARSVIHFYGVVVDDKEEHVKGLLIGYAERGALLDVIYDHDHSLPWRTREKWARQIVHGLSEIHEAGFVQGDFTLSNIVIDDGWDAKIIDMNRRGCPVGWEPPEATPLIESGQRIAMYIGVKSDLYQLGMVLWALATEEDEPEAHGRPLRLGADVQVPGWYRRIVEVCLSDDPRRRIQALQLLSMFPPEEEEEEEEEGDDRDHRGPGVLPSISVDDGFTRREYTIENPALSAAPHVKNVNTQPLHDWAYVPWDDEMPPPEEQQQQHYHYYPTRGRSPPSPLPSNHGGDGEGGFQSPRYRRGGTLWPEKDPNALAAPSISDVPRSDYSGGESDVCARTNEGTSTFTRSDSYIHAQASSTNEATHSFDRPSEFSFQSLYSREGRESSVAGEGTGSNDRGLRAGQGSLTCLESGGHSIGAPVSTTRESSSRNDDWPSKGAATHAVAAGSATTRMGWSSSTALAVDSSHMPLEEEGEEEEGLANSRVMPPPSPPSPPPVMAMRGPPGVPVSRGGHESATPPPPAPPPVILSTSTTINGVGIGQRPPSSPPHTPPRLSDDLVGIGSAYDDDDGRGDGNDNGNGYGRGGTAGGKMRDSLVLSDDFHVNMAEFAAAAAAAAAPPSPPRTAGGGGR